MNATAAVIDAEPRERPILFSGRLVRRIFDGVKTQTRRAVRPNWWRCLSPDDEDDRAQAVRLCPYGATGDRLWVRETWTLGRANFGKKEGPVGPPSRNGATAPVLYRANELYNDADHRWRPSIHMPRWASRLTLEVTGVRVERLQEISEADAIAEGSVPLTGLASSHRYAFQRNWDSLYAETDTPWSSNPWVWVIEFKRLG